MFEMFWWLLVGHALADFPLQGEAMAKGKNRHHPRPEPGFYPHWAYWLTAHALIHGGMVGVLTDSAPLGMAETLAHWAIDYGKCEGWYGFHVDQALHAGCKLGWCFVVLQA